MRPPLAPPRLSEPRKVEADAHAVETNCETVRPEAAMTFCLQCDATSFSSSISA